MTENSYSASNVGDLINKLKSVNANVNVDDLIKSRCVNKNDPISRLANIKQKFQKFSNFTDDDGGGVFNSNIGNLSISKFVNPLDKKSSIYNRELLNDVYDAETNTYQNPYDKYKKEFFECITEHFNTSDGDIHQSSVENIKLKSYLFEGRSRQVIKYTSNLNLFDYFNEYMYDYCNLFDDFLYENAEDDDLLGIHHKVFKMPEKANSNLNSFEMKQNTILIQKGILDNTNCVDCADCADSSDCFDCTYDDSYFHYPNVNYRNNIAGGYTQKCIKYCDENDNFTDKVMSVSPFTLTLESREFIMAFFEKLGKETKIEFKNKDVNLINAKNLHSYDDLKQKDITNFFINGNGNNDGSENKYDKLCQNLLKIFEKYNTIRLIKEKENEYNDDYTFMEELFNKIHKDVESKIDEHCRYLMHDTNIFTNEVFFESIEFLEGEQGDCLKNSEKHQISNLEKLKELLEHKLKFVESEIVKRSQAHIRKNQAEILKTNHKLILPLFFDLNNFFDTDPSQTDAESVNAIRTTINENIKMHYIYEMKKFCSGKSISLVYGAFLVSLYILLNSDYSEKSEYPYPDYYKILIDMIRSNLNNNNVFDEYPLKLTYNMVKTTLNYNIKQYNMFFNKDTDTSSSFTFNFHQAPYLLSFFFGIKDNWTGGTCQDKAIAALVRQDSKRNMKGVMLQNYPTISHWEAIDEKNLEMFWNLKEAYDFADCNLINDISRDKERSFVSKTGIQSKMAMAFNCEDEEYCKNNLMETFFPSIERTDRFARMLIFAVITLSHIYRHSDDDTVRTDMVKNLFQSEKIKNYIYFTNTENITDISEKLNELLSRDHAKIKNVSFVIMEHGNNASACHRPNCGNPCSKSFESHFGGETSINGNNGTNQMRMKKKRNPLKFYIKQYIMSGGDPKDRRALRKHVVELLNTKRGLADRVMKYHQDNERNNASTTLVSNK
jgi:hypothetical protein